MDHINYTRQVGFIRSLALGQMFPANYVSGNFAVFDGEHAQRRAIALQAMRQCVGKVGIVLLHNDPIFSSDLERLLSADSDVNLYYANPNPANSRYYDPLYGLSEAGVLNALVPLTSDSPRYQDQITLRSNLQDYLSIMAYQFEQDPKWFGEYPYNLDLLTQLVYMPYPQLKRDVLSYLPSYMQTDLDGRLSKESVQSSVMAALRNFATMAKRQFWTPANWANHSRISIVSAVSQKDILSIYVPGSDPAMLDYLELELEELTHNNIPYLLVESGLNIHNSPKIANRFLSEHSQLNYRTGIVTQSSSSILRTEGDELANLLAEYQEIVVLACSGKPEAERFSAAMDTYFRIVTSTTRNTARRMFSILPTHTRGTERHEVEERNVRANELENLGDGAVLWGKNHPYPVIVDHVTGISSALTVQ